MGHLKKSFLIGPLVTVIVVVLCILFVWRLNEKQPKRPVQPALNVPDNVSARDEPPGKTRKTEDRTGQSGRTLGADTNAPERNEAEEKAQSISGRAETGSAGTTVGDLLAMREFSRFFEWTKDQQVQAVTAAMKNPKLPEEVVDFFKTALRDHRLGRLVRNNMASALHNQEKKTPFLHEVFIASIDDKDDLTDWRLYSIQHLAFTYSYTAEPHVVLRKLEDLADAGEEPYGTQAMVMLDDLEHSGQIRLAGINQAIERRLKDPGYDKAAKMSALTLVGRRGLRELVDTVRRYAAEQSEVQRTAIAALGRIGDKTDVPLLERLANDNNELLASSAKSALESIRQRTRQ
jgi:hypothetical protein